MDLRRFPKEVLILRMALAILPAAATEKP